jgi:hypothetical protein
MGGDAQQAEVDFALQSIRGGAEVLEALEDYSALLVQEQFGSYRSTSDDCVVRVDKFDLHCIMLMKRRSRCSVSPTDVYLITLLRYVGKFSAFFECNSIPKRRQPCGSGAILPSGICAWHFSTTCLYPFRLCA